MRAIISCVLMAVLPATLNAQEYLVRIKLVLHAEKKEEPIAQLVFQAHNDEKVTASVEGEKRSTNVTFHAIRQSETNLTVRVRYIHTKYVYVKEVDLDLPNFILVDTEVTIELGRPFISLGGGPSCGEVFIEVHKKGKK